MGAFRALTDESLPFLPEEPVQAAERVHSLFSHRAHLFDPDLLSKLLTGDLSNLRDAPEARLDESIRQKIAEHVKNLLPETEPPTRSNTSQIIIYGIPTPLRDVSDGYGSLLALVGHLFRHALALTDWQIDPANVFGLVLIDEVDLHLHPAWQRRILIDLVDTFPNVHFIATSHSPIIAGSIATDSVIVLRRADHAVDVITDLESVEGLRADQIATSELFSLSTTRSVQTEDLFSKYSQAINKHGLDDPEVRELANQVSKRLKIRGESDMDEKAHQLLDSLVESKFNHLARERRDQILARAGLMITKATDNDQD